MLELAASPFNGDWPAPIAISAVLLAAGSFAADRLLKRHQPSKDLEAAGSAPADSNSVQKPASTEKSDRRGIAGLVVGVDGRTSTSKLQVLLWTYGFAWAIVALLIGSIDAGLTDGWNKLVNGGLKEEYLLLLGLPTGAAVAAYKLTSDKVGSGTVQKDTTDATGLGARAAEVISDDDGNTDLIDFQYLLFNLVALAYFVVRFMGHASEGLPDLPDILVGLTGTAALGYTLNKAAQGQVPALNALVPGAGKPSTKVKLYGNALDGDPAKAEITVMFGEKQSPHTSRDAGVLTAEVPDMPAGKVMVTVVLALRNGLVTNPREFVIEPP
jgi:hypothetical protein